MSNWRRRCLSTSKASCRSSKTQKSLQFFISASAVGYYGAKTSEEIMREEMSPAQDFVGQLCRDWEAAADQFEGMCQVAKVRTALVLDKDEGALHAISLPTKFGLGAPLGKGKQWMPWIHREDLASIFLHIIENKLAGAFNGVAPEHVNNKDFTKAVAKAFHVPMILPGIPKALMRVALGEKASLLLEGSRVSSQKIQDAGFTFKYDNLVNALRDLYS